MKSLSDYEYYRTKRGVLYCGDCLEILPLIEDKSVDLVLTDPPYGMNWTGEVTRGKNGTGKIGKSKYYGIPIINDDHNFDPSPFLNYPVVILWGFHHFANKLPNGTVLVWIKRYDSGFGSFLSDADLAWMNKGHGVYCRRDLSLQGESKTKIHPTQKPIGIIQWCIEKSQTDGLILDPFLGSGTTAVACEKLNRRWIGIEISEEYCKLAKERIESEMDMFTNLDEEAE